MLVFKNKRKGFALTEILLSIAVIVIIGIVAYPLYKNARESAQVEQIANDMAILMKNSNLLFPTQSYTEIKAQTTDRGITMMDLLNQNGLVPDDLKSDDAGNPYTSPFGGYFVVAGLVSHDSIPYDDSGRFSIQMSNIPTNLCPKLIARIAPSFTSIFTTINKDFVKEPQTAISADSIARVCSNSWGGGQPVQLTFEFK